MHELSLAESCGLRLGVFNIEGDRERCIAASERLVEVGDVMVDDALMMPTMHACDDVAD